MIRYTIKLTKTEVAELEAIIHKGSQTTMAFRNAYILLNCDTGDYAQKVTNEVISKVLRVGLRTIDRVKKRFCEEGMEAVLKRKPTTRIYEKKADGDYEAKLIALCCSTPPEGFVRWTLRMLAEKTVELGYIDDISHVTVHNILKKTKLSLGKQKVG